MTRATRFPDPYLDRLREAKILGERAGTEHRRSEKLRRAVTLAYGTKYNTQASEKWARGFAERARQVTTLELLPN